MTETNNQQNNQDIQETAEMQNNNVVEETIVDDVQQDNEQQEYQQETYQQQTYQQEAYQQPVYQQPAVTKSDTSKTISILDWILTIIVMSIPVVNIIMLFVFAFAGEKESKKNLFKAQIILMATAVIAFIVFLIVFVVFMGHRLPELLDQLNQFKEQYGY